VSEVVTSGGTAASDGARPTTSTTNGGAPAIESGDLAVLGHGMLGAVSVIAGAVDTLRESNGSLSASQRARLEEAVGRSPAHIAEVARLLVAGQRR